MTLSTPTDGQFGTIIDMLSADPDNESDVAFIAKNYAGGDRELALRQIKAAQSNQVANSAYHEALSRDHLVGPANPFFGGLSGVNQSLGYQIAAGVPRTELSPGLSEAAAKAIYDANPDGPPTDMS